MKKEANVRPGLPMAKRVLVVLAAAALAVTTGCASPVKKEVERDIDKLQNNPPERHPETTLRAQMEELNRRQQALRALQQIDDPKPDLDPVMPEYNPLDDVMVSLEMDQADVRHVLMILAKETGMNLLIDPEVVNNPPELSISFRSVPASMVFEKVLRIADLSGRVENNVLHVTPYEEAMFQLDFLETNSSMSYDVGGNVLGGGRGQGGGAGGGSGSSASTNAGHQLMGRFSIRGTGPSVTNPYEQIDRALAGMVTGGGRYQLNRMTGVLYVRAKPSAVRAVRQLVERYKKVLSRQILIEARIMEVRLSDDFRAGVDWAMIRDQLAVTRGFSQDVNAPSSLTLPANGNGLFSLNIGDRSNIVPGGGLGITYGNGNSIAVVNLLKQFGDVNVVSNPTIRAKHGQPALISVGQTNSFVRDTSVTTNTGGGAAVTETEVNVDSVFDGLIVGVVPFITEEGRVSLMVHPIQSDVDENSLALQVLSGNTAVALPRVDLKEISTVLEMNNNDTVLLGGLIDKGKSRTRTAVPMMAEIPVLGALFRNEVETDSLRELVIMLRVSQL